MTVHVSTWQALCPQREALASDRRLHEIAVCLADPEVQRSLDLCETDRSYPQLALDRLWERGLSTLFAEETGERSYVTAYHLSGLNELAARSGATLAITLGVNGLALLPAYIGASEPQLQHMFARVRKRTIAAILLSEWEHGSDLLANQASALPVDASGHACDEPTTATHFRLDGEKTLINGAEHAGLLVTLLRTRTRPEPATEGQDPDGVLGRVGDFTMFMIDREEDGGEPATIEALSRHRTLPAAGAEIGGVGFRGTLVPRSRVLGGEGQGFLLIQRTLAISRGGVSALASGAVTRASQLALEHARSRSLYGRPIVALGAIGDHLMRILALDALVSAMSLKAIAVVNHAGPAAAHYTAVAKLICCSLAEEAVDEGRELLGARALVGELPYERLVRDVLLYGVFDGTSHVMLEQIQWRLVQMTARKASPRQIGADDSIARLREAYRAAPRRLIEVGREGGRPWLFAIDDHARALSELPGRIDVGPLVELAGGLVALVERLRSAGLWDADQGLRFDAAETLCHLEATLALIELADPDRRAALGMAPACGAWASPAGLAITSFAIGWLGGRIEASLRRLTIASGVEPAEGEVDLDRCARSLARVHREARHVLRAVIER